jgi:hypothetical protein
MQCTTEKLLTLTLEWTTVQDSGDKRQKCRDCGQYLETKIISNFLIEPMQSGSAGRKSNHVKGRKLPRNETSDVLGPAHGHTLRNPRS